ncbi:hypothetical protein KC345_g11081, partial [Hortaea werneckii]
MFQWKGSVETALNYLLREGTPQELAPVYAEVYQGDSADNWAERNRRDAYTGWCNAHGIKPSMVRMDELQGEWTECLQSLADAGRPLPPLLVNWSSAISDLYRAAHRLGLRIGEDLRVMAADNTIQGHRLSLPSLSCVEIPYELEGYRYREIISLDEWLVAEDKDGDNGVYPSTITGEGKLRTGDYWTGSDVYLWLHRKIAIPADWQGKRVVGLFDFGRTGGGNNSGFESLLFLDGKPYQGVDSNHQEVFLEEDTAGRELDFTFRLWSGLNGDGQLIPQEHRIKRAELAYLDESTDNLYYTGRAALATCKQLADSQIEKHELLMALNRSLGKLDWSRPGSADFYASVQEAEKLLLEEMSRLERKHPVTVTAIGHTHIDVAWLWRLTHTREKAARSFSTVLRLMKQFPEYIFLQTQPQLYAYIKQDYPEIYGQIKQRVEEGRWEAGGAMWLEADCNLTSGESLVRQILYGTKFFREEFGVDCKYLWLPDVFGYSWALPQILRKSGIDTFMTTKISWSQYNRMPHDTFQWRGIDGSEVLTHFITTPDSPDASSWYYTYNGLLEPYSVQGIWDQYQDKNLNRELLLSYGYGDGGGGVNREMLEMRRRLDTMPGLPQVKTGRADDYFERLHESIEGTDQYVHTWDGELYLEFH